MERDAEVEPALAAVEVCVVAQDFGDEARVEGREVGDVDVWDGLCEGWFVSGRDEGEGGKGGSVRTESVANVPVRRFSMDFSMYLGVVTESLFQGPAPRPTR